MVAELDRAVGGVISVARADAALARYQHAVDTWSQGPEQGEPDLAAHADYADRLADSGDAHGAGRCRRRIAPPFIVSIVDDDVGGPYKVGPRDVFTHTCGRRG